MGSEPDAFGRIGTAVADLARITDRLRAECPWDKEQTHESLAPHLLEEAFETHEAIDAGEPTALREELGDLLFQVVIHSQLAREDGQYDLADVAAGLSEKLVRRHPHVFEGKPIEGGDVLKQWDRIKNDEKREASAHARLASERFAARIKKTLERARSEGRDLGSYDPDELWKMWEATR